MEVYTNGNDRTRISLASFGRIVASIHVSDDDGISFTHYGHQNWPDDVMPNFFERRERRNDGRLPVALVNLMKVVVP